MAQGTGEVFTSTIPSPAISTAGTLKRTVSDIIRELWPKSAPILALTAKGSPSETGGEVSGKGLISKKSTGTFKFEWFTFTPIGVTFTVASGSNLAPVLSSATGLRPGMTVVNLDNMKVAIVDAISTNTLTLVSLGATFTSKAGDKFLASAPAYKEGSAAPEQMSKDEDNVYNYVQIFRFAVEIDRTAKTNPHYGGDYFSRLKKRAFTQGKRYVENSILFGQRAASGDTTATANRGNVHSTRGMWNFAAKTYNASGSMTAEKFRKDMILAMSDTVDDDDEYLMFSGRNIYSECQEFYQDKLQINQKDGKYANLGLKSDRIKTAGPITHLMKHNAFDQPGNQNRALIFRPEDITLRFKTKADWQAENNMQANDQHTQEDGVWGTCGVQVSDGGQNMLKVENWGAVQ